MSVNKQKQDPARCVNTAIRRAARAIGQLYDDVLAPIGLRATQHTMLLTIRDMKEPTFSDLAGYMLIEASALSRALKPLERDGLIVVSRDIKDGRAKRVTLTDAGSKMLDRSLGLWKDAQSQFEDAFGAKPTEHLCLTLDGLTSSEFRQAFRERTAKKRG